MNIEQLKKDRFNFLNLVYKTAEGDRSAILDMWEVGNHLKFDQDYTMSIATYLIDEGLLESRALGGGIGLAHAGIKEVEQAFSYPNKATKHFLPVNIIQVHSMTNSVIQQGSPYAAQSISITVDATTRLKEFVLEVRNAVERLELASEQQTELLAELKTLEAQLNSPKPKATILKETLTSVKTILEGVTVELVKPYAQSLLSHLAPILSQMTSG